MRDIFSYTTIHINVPIYLNLFFIILFLQVKY